MPVPTLHLRFIGPRNVPKGIRRGKGARAIFPRRKKKREKIEGEKTKRNCFGGGEERRGKSHPSMAKREEKELPASVAAKVRHDAAIKVNFPGDR